jgi:hypothetical protein
MRVETPEKPVMALRDLISSQMRVRQGHANSNVPAFLMMVSFGLSVVGHTQFSTMIISKAIACGQSLAGGSRLYLMEA